jgi:hypothetical protein
MSNQNEKVLSTSWNLVREAGTAVGDAAANSRVGTSLVRNLPKVKEMISVGAGLAVARKGAKAAVAAVRRNPAAAIAGAVALAGVGVAVAMVRQRKAARANGDASATTAASKPRRLAATNMRKTNTDGSTKPVAAKSVAKSAAKPATKSPRTRK